MLRFLTWLRAHILAIAVALLVTASCVLLAVLLVAVPVACPTTLTTAWRGVGAVLHSATECQRLYGQAFQFFANAAQIAGGISILVAILSLLIEHSARAQERREQTQRETSERQRQEERDQQLLWSLLDRAITELHDNQQASAAIVRQLERETEEALDRREKLLLWAAAIASLLSSRAYESLHTSGVGHLLPSNIEAAVRNASYDATDLRVQGEISIRSWTYFRGVSAAECLIVYGNLLNRSVTVRDSLKHAMVEVWKYARAAPSV
jgi:hypothetical protein